MLNKIKTLFTFSDSPYPSAEKSIEVKKVHATPVKIVEVGSSGTEIYAGYIDEEYLHDLKGTKAMKIYDKMRRSDPRIKMVLSAVKNPIKSADWYIGTKEDSEQAEAQKKLIEHILFSGLRKSWKKNLHEVLSMIDFGYSAQEVTHKPVLNDKEFGPHVGLKSLKLVGQKTVERFNVNSDGTLKSITQYSNGDVGRNVNVPAEFILHFSIDKEGDNYEGVSMLRACYGPWLRKNNALKQESVGNQNFSTPIAVMSVPDGEQNSEQYARAVTFLENYANNSASYLIKPQGWELELVNNTFDSAKIRETIKSENEEIAFAFLANFLNLGSGLGGSYALSNDLSDFFSSSLEFIADEICETYNLKLIPDLIKLNFPNAECLVELKVSGIADKAGKEFAEVIELLTRSKTLTPDHELEESLRKKYKLPKMVEIEVENNIETPDQLRAMLVSIMEKLDAQKAQPEQVQTTQFAEKKTKKETPDVVVKRINDNAEVLKSVFRSGLEPIAKDMVKKLLAKYNNTTEAREQFAIFDIKPSGVNAYNTTLRNEFGKIVNQAYDSVAVNYKFADRISNNRARAKADLLYMTQLNDLEKAIFLQFGTSVDSTDSVKTLEADLMSASDKAIKTMEVGADIVSAQLENETRMDFFDENSDELESFTFYNGDPISDICQELNGSTYSINDPDLLRYTPPLHHNCKSVMIPNLKGDKNNPQVGGLPAISNTAKKGITLGECCNHNH